MRTLQTVPIAEVLQISTDRIEPRDFADRSFNYIGLEDIESNTGRVRARGETRGSDIQSTKSVFRAGQILYGRLRPYLNKVHLARKEGICSTDIFVLTCDQKLVLPAYATYYLRSAAVLEMVKNLTVGANLPRVDVKGFLGIPIPLVPLQEQERVVHLLNEAEALRQLGGQADEGTAQMLFAVFATMFGDPLNADGRWPVRSLSEICGPHGIKAGPFGSSLKKDSYTELGPRVYGQEQVIASDFAVGDYHISEAKYSEMRAYAVEEGDVLISLVGTIGRAVVVPRGIDPGIINPRLLRIRPTRTLVLPEFLVTILGSPSATQYLAGIAGGMTMGVLNAGLLKNMRIIVPPIQLQQAFATRVSEIRELARMQATRRRLLDELFGSLLHRAFQGEI